jgi:hypothetical protein
MSTGSTIYLVSLPAPKTAQALQAILLVDAKEGTLSTKSNPLYLYVSASRPLAKRSPRSIR